jgi:propionate CoA-transferase
LHDDLPEDLVLTTEAGVVGGAPTSGLFFGAAINPTELISSAEMFHRYAERLDLACVGLLEVDGRGNVNVSRRGAAVTDHVGPGGFPDITHHAQTVLFVGSFALGERLELSGAQLLVREQGRPKFVDTVREVTFNAERALRRGQRVFYVTHRGVFRLRDDGLELTHVMPGIDAERDILSAPAPIKLPVGGIDAVQTLGPEIVTGIGHLRRGYSAPPAR